MGTNVPATQAEPGEPEVNDSGDDTLKRAGTMP